MMARTVVHGERLQHTRQGRGIFKFLWNSTEDILKLPERFPPREDYAENTENKPSTRDGDKKQERLVKVHIKVKGAWKEETSGILTAYRNTVSLDGPITLKTAAVIFPTL